MKFRKQEKQYRSISDEKYFIRQHGAYPNNSSVRIIAGVAVIGAIAGIGISRLSTPARQAKIKY
jgi:hypothetical protein